MALLLLGACSERGAPTASQAQDRPGALTPASSRSTFAGVWTVASVDGVAAASTGQQSPINVAIDASWIRGSADCAFLGERSYAVRDQVLIVGPPPPGAVGSCARGLSTLEQAFTEVFQAGAVVRRVDDQLVLETSGRAIRMARRPWTGGAVRLALLPASLEGDAAAISGVLEVDGACLYVRTPYGDRILPALQTPDTRWDNAAGVLHVGAKAFLPGSRVQLGGSFLRGAAPLNWRQAPGPACNQERTWITVAMEPDPGPKVAGYSGEDLERLRAADTAK